MKFAFVQTEKANFPVKLMCKVLGVSRAGYYAWCNRPQSPRALENEALTVQIAAIHEASRGTYGSPRVHAVLREQGHEIGVNRVARLMRESEICVRPRRGFKCTTKADPTHPVVGNLLARDFTASAPNEKWVGDVTSVSTDEGWFHLAVVLDLFNREVVGWSMDAKHDQSLTLGALQMALQSHEPAPGLIYHSDRGSTYTSNDYRDQLEQHGLDCSMSRKGNCLDNAVAESFFATLKKELVHRTRFRTKRQAAAAIFEYIEVFYNRIRLHSSIGYTTPVAYRKRVTNSTMAA